MILASSGLIIIQSRLERLTGKTRNTQFQSILWNMTVAFELDFDRALAALVYIAAKKPHGLDVYKLCKLVFLSDKLHLVRYARPITGDTIRAMEYGPVPSCVYDLLKGLVADSVDDERVTTLREFLAVDKAFAYPRFSCKRELDFDEYLSKSDMQVLAEIMEQHGRKTFEELKSLTHEMPAWKHAWNDPQRSAKNPVMSFEELFIEDSEALAGVCEEMLENFQLRQVFDDHRV